MRKKRIYLLIIFVLEVTILRVEMRRTLFIFLTVFFFTACNSGKVNSVVLVTVDGLSAKDADTLASITKNAATFDNALTPCPVTLPAVATIFTGFHPAGHGIEGSGNGRLEDAAGTLAELFRSNQWRTAAFIGSSDLGLDTGIGQGFDSYQYVFENIQIGPFAHTVFKNASSVSEKAIKWIGIFGDKPFFIWAHYGDMVDDWAAPLGESEKKKRLDEITASINKLMDALPDKGAGTLFILTSPAANAMGAHGEQGHGIFLYDSTLKIPLIISGPTIKAEKLSAPVSLEDIFPTVISLLNFGFTGKIQGIDLTPLLRVGKDAKPDRGRFIITKEPLQIWGLSPLKAVVKGNYKLIVDSTGHVEFFDRQADPNEEHNITAPDQKIPDELKKELASLEKSAQAEKLPAKSPTPVATPEASLSSPMNKIKALQLFEQASLLVRQKNNAGAYQTLSEAVSMDPGNKRLVVALAMVAESIQPKNVVLTMWENAVKLNPDDPMALTSLAKARQSMGDREGALAALEKTLGSQAENPEAHLMAANILVDNAAKLKGQPRREMLEKALRHIIVIMRGDNPSAKAFYMAGEILLGIAEVTKTLLPASTSGKQTDRATEAKSFENAARKTFEQAIELDPKMAEAHLALVRLLAAQNDAAGAKKHIEQYLKLAPQGPGADEARKILKTLK